MIKSDYKMETNDQCPLYCPPWKTDIKITVLKEILTQERDVSASSCRHYQMQIIVVLS